MFFQYNKFIFKYREQLCKHQNQEISKAIDEAFRDMNNFLSGMEKADC